MLLRERANQSLWSRVVSDNQYLLVKSEQRSNVVEPHRCRPEDVTDHPISITGYQVRVNSAGNIVASPTNGTSTGLQR
jgi:hypothetical protein